MNGTELAIAIQSGYEQGFNDGAIEELEKIKDRLEIAMWYNRRDKEYCIDLIDKRISELKGE